MKRRMHLVLLFSLSIFVANFAQVTEESKSMKLGDHNALVIKVDNATEKIAESVWKDMIKKYRGKTKKKRKEEQMTIEKVRLSAITGQESGTIYSQIEEEEGSIQLSLWVPGAEEYLSSSSNIEAYRAAEKLLEDYALEVRIAVVDEEFKSKERILETYQKDLTKLKKDNEGYHKTIKKSEEAIEDSEKGLVRNAESQERIKEELGVAESVFDVADDRLREMLRNAETKDEKKSIKKLIKGEEGKVKDVEKSLKKAEREEKKMNKTIETSKDNIHQAELDIEKNVKDQERKVEVIAENQDIVDEVKARLDKLKSYRK